MRDTLTILIEVTDEGTTFRFCDERLSKVWHLSSKVADTEGSDLVAMERFWRIEHTLQDEEIAHNVVRIDVTAGGTAAEVVFNVYDADASPAFIVWQRGGIVAEETEEEEAKSARCPVKVCNQIGGHRGGCTNAFGILIRAEGETI